MFFTGLNHGSFRYIDLLLHDHRVAFGQPVEQEGALIHFYDVDIPLGEPSLLDHKYLNELDYFQQDQPSSENIAYFVATELQKKVNDSAVSVSRVTAWESDDAGATYIVPAQTDS